MHINNSNGVIRRWRFLTACLFAGSNGEDREGRSLQLKLCARRVPKDDSRGPVRHTGSKSLKLLDLLYAGGPANAGKDGANGRGGCPTRRS